MAKTPTVQRSYRFRADLLERFEARVPRQERTATVSRLMEEWLDRSDDPRSPFAAEVARQMRAAEVEFGPRFSRVANAAGDGTLVRVEEPDLFAVHDIVGVARTEEVMRVREKGEDGLLAVDRGVSSRAIPLRVGDELLILGSAQYAADGEASPAADDLSPVGAAAGRSDSASDRAAVGSEVEGGESESRRAAPPVSPGPGADEGGSVSAGTDAPSSATAPDGERAVSAAAVPDGQARARVAPAPSETSDFAGDGLDPVDLAVELAGKTGDPAAVWRARIREDRVTVAGRPFRAGIIDRGLLEHVELDGARVG